ncbi:MAG: hypothetical protein FJ125_03675 [Deltaproteobacteria bacterium]|nr:hypothetical protein [Deltaproteobacteria bacterium]
MKCNTVRPGVECLFMKRAGCTYDGGSCRPIVDDCVGCERIAKHGAQDFCGSYPEPEIQWRGGICSFATHRRVSISTGEVLSSNPLKASKRAARKK